MKSRFGWALGGALLLGFILVLARGATAGPLDPPGPVGSTMRTLDELLPAWNKNLPATGGCDSQRFDCVLAGDVAVLDHETGIVWERVPDSTTRDWDAAYQFCAGRTIGGRQGWRLPSLSEQQSLLDGASLPSEHPFTLPTVPTFWTTTPGGVAPDEIFVVLMSNGTTGTNVVTNTLKAWCVRGPGADGGAVARRDDPFGSWDSLLSSSAPSGINICNKFRFQCVMGGTAVLDRETGLVWQRTPSEIGFEWFDAQDHCANVETGGRMGWRLPSIDELTSLIDPSRVGPGVLLPSVTPFNVGVTEAWFWSSTGSESGSFPLPRWFAALSQDEPVNGSASISGALTLYRAWCVRGAGGSFPV